MTEDEARAFLNARGWTLHINRKRRKEKTYTYLEASKKTAGKTRHIHLCSLARLATISEADILRKLPHP